MSLLLCVDHLFSFDSVGTLHRGIDRFIFGGYQELRCPPGVLRAGSALLIIESSFLLFAEPV